MGKFKDEVEVHVPTTVFQRHYQDVEALNDSIYHVVDDLESRYKDTDQNEANKDTVTTKGGYQTPNRINFFDIDNKAIKQLRDDVVLPSINEFLVHHFKEAAKDVNPWPKGWANLLHKGDWQAPHAHPSNGIIASGSYYVKMPKEIQNPEGCIEFINPMPASWHHGFPFSRRIEPKEGLIVIFPPWYQHYVHPFKKDDTRCVVAFDVLANKPGMEFVF